MIPEHTFIPRLDEVLRAWRDLWMGGLFFHILATLKLCLIATLISILFSSIIAYLSYVPFFASISNAFTKLRYNPIQGFTLFLTIIAGGGRSLQVTLLVIFMSFYFITSLMSIIQQIPKEQIYRRKAQGMGRWKILYEVVVKDYADQLVEVIRQNLSITFMMIVSVEAMDKAQGGLGAMINDTNRGLNFARIFALQITILLIGIILDSILRFIFKSFPANKKQ
jgi:ABC-type nitrate/sulfonate/bicarbonate transport system permease component